MLPWLSRSSAPARAAAPVGDWVLRARAPTSTGRAAPTARWVVLRVEADLAAHLGEGAGVELLSYEI